MFFQKNVPLTSRCGGSQRGWRKRRYPLRGDGRDGSQLPWRRGDDRCVEVLLTREGLEHFRNELVPKFYQPVEGHPRRFEERTSGLFVDCFVKGHFPGRRGPGPIPFPDPAQVSQEIDKVHVITLPQLIQLKLAARRYYDLGDVVFLIRVHNLDESLLPQLHPSVHRDFVGCLEEKRRDDEFEARE